MADAVEGRLRADLPPITPQTFPAFSPFGAYRPCWQLDSGTPCTLAASPSPASAACTGTCPRPPACVRSWRAGDLCCTTPGHRSQPPDARKGLRKFS